MVLGRNSAGQWGQLHDVQGCDWYFSLNNIRMIKHGIGRRDK
jgi:hypothetical protein